MVTLFDIHYSLLDDLNDSITSMDSTDLRLAPLLPPSQQMGDVFPRVHYSLISRIQFVDSVDK